MWFVKCQPGSKHHVEQMAKERIILHLRNIYNIVLSEKEVKEKVLEILKTSSKKEQIKSDLDSNIPKYKLYGVLPGTTLRICLYILEYKGILLREVRTIIDQHNIMSNKNIQRIFLDRKKKGMKRFQDKIQKKRNK